MHQIHVKCLRFQTDANLHLISLDSRSLSLASLKSYRNIPLKLLEALLFQGKSNKIFELLLN